MGTDATDASQSDPGHGGQSPNTMKKVSVAFYDQSTPGTGSSDVGDGNVTESRAIHGSGANDYYKTIYLHDWRNRLVQTRAHNKLTGKKTLDNLGRTTYADTYRDADTDWTPDAGEYYAKSFTAYDQKGQVYANVVGRIVNGSPSSGLTTWYAYDERGRLMKTKRPSGLFTKTSYDGAGRVKAAYLSYDTGETTYADAKTVAGDTVIEQVEYTYDKAGNVTLVTAYQRTEDTTKEGDLSSGWDEEDSRRTFTAKLLSPFVP